MTNIFTDAEDFPSLHLTSHHLGALHILVWFDFYRGLKCDANCTFTVVNCWLLCENGRVCSGPIGRLNEAVIPDSVEEHCNKCFYGCMNLSRVSPGQSPSLKRIGIEAFCHCGMRKIRISRFHCDLACGDFYVDCDTKI